MLKYKFPLGIFAITLVYLSGIIGLHSSYREWFLAFTPANLIFTVIILIIFQENNLKKFTAGLAIVYLMGLGVEIIGVNTGWPFGSYEYGTVLGNKIWGTPLLIGINWFIMVYGVTSITSKFKTNRLTKSSIVGLAITLLDIIIEPVAIELGFWNWFGAEIPLANYLSWFVIGTIMSYLILFIMDNIKNQIAKYVILAQVIFFLSMRLL